MSRIDARATQCLNHSGRTNLFLMDKGQTEGKNVSTPDAPGCAGPKGCILASRSTGIWSDDGINRSIGKPFVTAYGRLHFAVAVTI